MKKKVCLITYCHSPNYGAALQLYATYKAIELVGGNPIVLNYDNLHEKSQTNLSYKLFSEKNIKDFFKLLISGYIFRSKINGVKNFEKIYNELNYSKKIESVSELTSFNDVDVFCVGSDQVWNPQITGDYDDVFFLNSDNLAQKRISYASSMGSLNYPTNDTYVYKALSKFSYISVREGIASDYLSHLLEKNVRTVVDPTLLFDCEEWLQFARSSSFCGLNEKYVLVYALGGKSETLIKVAKRVAKKIGSKVALITLSTRPRGVDYQICNASPLDFVNLFSKAEFIITNSFHGTCFSINLKKPFLSIYYDANPGRAKDLLTKYELENRFVKTDSDIDDVFFITKDIENANRLIREDANNARVWLERAINE